MSDLPDPEQFDFHELLVRREWLRCAPESSDPDELLQGFLYFCETYWHIRHPARWRIKFDLFDAQIETVKSWLNHRYSLILKARQIGFSTLVAAYAFWMTFFYSDRPVLMLSRTEREAIKLLQKAKYGRQFLPDWMKFEGGPYNETQTRMEFSNASYIESLPSASDPARGESAYLVVVDELAFLPNSEEAWGAIEPVADVGGRVIMLSTANGVGNLFHELWTGAVAGNNRFEPLFFPWSANGRDSDWYEAKRLDLPDWQLAQEYPSDPREAFLKSGRPVFNLEALHDMETCPPVAQGYLKQTTEFIEDGGALSIWEWPTAEGKYVIGADPSQGLEHGDYASVHVVEARTRHMVAHWHGHIDPDLLASDVLIPLGKFYGKALIGVESNNHGLTTLKVLSRLKYFPIYYDRNPRSNRNRASETLGFRTTQVTKPLIIDSLNESLRGGMKVPCKNTVGELMEFSRDDRGKMAGQPWDDRTISLAIANHMLRFVWMAEFQPKEEPKPGTWSDWERRTYGSSFSDLIESKKPRIKREPIGSFAVRRR